MSMSKFIKEAEFNKIKTLLNAGLTTKVIQELTNRSNVSINRIKRCDDWKAYQKYMSDMAKKYVKTVVTKEPEAIDPIDTPVKPFVTFGKFNDNGKNLERIAIALERLANAWETQPKKSKFWNS